MQTLTAITGSVKYTFAYDGSGHLTSITDAFSNQTTFNYTSGLFSGVTSSNSISTAVSLDGNGYIATLTTPNSEVYHLASSSTGLLTSFQKPGGTTTTLAYDTYGNLTSDSSSAGSSTTLAVTSSDQNDVYMTSTSALSRVTNISVQSSSNNYGYSRTVTDPSGFVTTYNETPATYQSNSTYPNSQYLATSLGSDGLVPALVEIG